QSRLDAMEGAGEVDRDHLLPALLVQFVEALADGLAGVVDQDADQAEALPGRVEGGLYIGPLRDVARDEAYPVAIAQFGAGLLQSSFAPAHERDARALLQQAPRHDQADAARRAGDQGVALGGRRGHDPTCSA